MAQGEKKQDREPKTPTVSLRVSEALTKDVGRGIVRLDPVDMERLGAHVGDAVFIHGKQTTVAKLAPAYLEHRGKRVLQMDGVLRENAKIGLDEKVKVENAEAKPAKALTLAMRAASSSRSSMPPSDERYVGRLLEGLPVLTGDKVRALLFGSRTRDFEVRATSPEGPVIITAHTKIEIEHEKGSERSDRSPSISYEDIGGLDKAIERIREMVELPLKHPEVFERLGIDPPKGVLLYGPPGTGKTLIARAVAHESDVRFFSINGPEVVHKFYGESEAHLRRIFEEAEQNAPSIIFIDEIDSVAPKRATVQGEVEKRIVATLLALMDGLKSRGEIIVIGATNLPDLLDPALRRPGRFDREIPVSIPDRNGRFKVLEIHTRGMPLAPSVDLGRLADITHGYVGADLEALAREAAMACLRRSTAEGEFRLEDIRPEFLASLEVTQDDFMTAMNEVQASGIREVAVESPQVHWSEVGGLSQVKTVLEQVVEWPLTYHKLCNAVRLKPSKGILLVGPPGVGKTLVAKALATESEVNFISVKGPELVSKYVGETERGVRDIFKKARSAAPCILFFDEIDTIAARRGAGGSDNGVMNRTLGQLLTEVDGLEELRGVVILAATNRLDLLDPALLRPGRFDHIVELDLPDLEAREEILAIHTRNRPVDKRVDIKALAKMTEGFSAAHLEALCREAAVRALGDFILQYGDKAEAASDKIAILNRHFDMAVTALRHSRDREEGGN